METTASTRRNKHFILNQAKLERAKKILGVNTETETVEIALERVIAEAETNKNIARNGLTLFTSNAKDFERIAEFRRFSWKLI